MRRSQGRLIVAVLITTLIAAVVPSTTPARTQAILPQPSIVAGRLSPSTVAQEPGYEYLSLKTTIAVWADGRGDIVVDQAIKNTGTEAILEHRWEILFGPIDYEPVLAWDPVGVLQHQIEPLADGIEIVVPFRYALMPGEEYQFAFSFSAASMADVVGDMGTASLQVSPGSTVQHFALGMILPLSASILTIDPQESNRINTDLEWQRSNTNADLRIEVTYQLSDQIPNVPLFYQTDDRWAGETWYTYPLGTPGETVSKWGCNLTSAAMLINYFAATQGSSFRTNPKELNAWIRRHGITKVHAIYSAALSYARENQVRMYMPVPSTGNEQDLRNYLRTGNPVILRVPAGASPSSVHFVVATGITTYQGTPTYSIHDPLDGATSLAQQGRNYNQVNLFNSTSPDQRTLMTIVQSPVEILVTDPLGRRVGRDPVRGIDYAEIPGAIYERDALAPDAAGGRQAPLEEKYVLIVAPVDGRYQVRLTGTDTGAYGLEYVATDWDGRLSTARLTGSTHKGVVHDYSLAYDGIVGVTSGYRLFVPQAFD